MDPLTIGLIAGGTALAGGGLGALSGSNIKKRSTLTGEQQDISARLKSLFQSIGQPLQAYPGQLYAGQTPLQQQAANYFQQLGQGLGSYLPQRQGAYAKALGGQALPGIDMSASKNWFQNQVVPQYMNAFQQFAAPAVEQARAMSGGVSSSGMNRALAGVSGDISRELGGMGYQYLLQEQQAQRQRDELNQALQMQAMGMAPPAMSFADQLWQAGERERQVERERIAAELQEWMRIQPEYSPLISAALDFLGTPMMAMYQEPNMASNILGGMGSLLGGTGSMLGGLGGLF